MIGPLLDDGGQLYVGTLTIGDDGGDDYGFLASTYGSISPTTYLDRGGNTRTFVAINFDDATNTLHLALSGSVPNTDTTFILLVLGSNVYSRADATFTEPSNSSWRWDTGGPNPIGTSGTQTVVIL